LADYQHDPQAGYITCYKRTLQNNNNILLFVYKSLHTNTLQPPSIVSSFQPLVYSQLVGTCYKFFVTPYGD